MKYRILPKAKIERILLITRIARSRMKSLSAITAEQNRAKAERHSVMQYAERVAEIEASGIARRPRSKVFRSMQFKAAKLRKKKGETDGRTNSKSRLQIPRIR